MRKILILTSFLLLIGVGCDSVQKDNEKIINYQQTILEEQKNQIDELTEKIEEIEIKTEEKEQDNLSKNWVNSCIISAQAERERRKSNIRYVWMDCLKDPLFDTKECEKYKDYTYVENLYKEWESNCERGIENIF